MLQQVIESSLDSNKWELSQLLYPVFIHMYLELVYNNHDIKAKAFFSNFRYFRCYATGVCDGMFELYAKEVWLVCGLNKSFGCSLQCSCDSESSWLLTNEVTVGVSNHNMSLFLTV